MNEEHKQLAIFLLKRMAFSDRMNLMSEQSYIDQAGRHLGLNQGQIDAITLEEFDIAQMPSNERERMTILYYVLFLMEADRVILKEEIDEFLKIGFELGFREDQLSRMIQVVEQNSNQNFDSEKLISVIRSVLN